MPTRLIGTDTPGDANTSANRLILGRFQASHTGTVTEIRVYSRANGHVKVAIYSDSAGEPDARLSYNNTSTAVTANQWNTISISSTTVAAGTYYWLAAANDVAGAISYTSGSGTSKGKTITFSSFNFPDPAGTGFTNYTHLRAFAGWGTVLLPPPGWDRLKEKIRRERIPVTLIPHDPGPQMYLVIREVREISVKVPGPPPDNKKFLDFVLKQLEAHVIDGKEPPAAIAPAVMNIADDLLSGRDMVIRAGDYIAMINFAREHKML